MIQRLGKVIISEFFAIPPKGTSWSLVLGAFQGVPPCPVNGPVQNPVLGSAGILQLGQRSPPATIGILSARTGVPQTIHGVPQLDRGTPDSGRYAFCGNAAGLSCYKK